MPLLVLATYRADETGPELRELLQKQHIVRMILTRLDQESVSEIVRSMLAAPDAPDPFLRFLSKESEGNPFFVAEYLRTAVDERLLRREQGRWRVAAEDTAYTSLGLPGTLRDLVGRRLDRLSPAAQRFAEAASVLGREVPDALLVAMFGGSDVQALEAMAELIERHVFEEIDAGVRFVHDKLREAAYARIDPDRLRELHRRAGEIIEASCTSEEELTRHASEIARHYDLGGADEKAIHYYPRGAEAALALGAGHEVIEQMKRAVALAERTPPRETRNERSVRRAHWFRLLGRGCWEAGELVGCEEYARESLAEVGVNLPRTDAGWKWFSLRQALEQAAHLALPRRWFRAGAAKERLLSEAAASAHFLSARSYYAAQQNVMLGSSLLVVNASERCTDAPFAAQAYSVLGTVASALGLHGISARYVDACRRIGIAGNDLIDQVYFAFTAHSHYQAICGWDRLEPISGEGLAIGRRAGDAGHLETALTGHGLYQFYTGQLEASYATNEELHQVARKRNSAQHEAWGNSGRALSLTLMDGLDDALAMLHEALRLLDGQNDTMSELIVRGQIVGVLRHLGRLEDAIAAADDTFGRVAAHGFVICHMMPALVAPAETYLEAWERARETDPARVAHMRRAMKDVLRRLRSLARRAPLALPVSERIAGVTACLEGNIEKGRALLRKSIADASRLGRPVEEGIGLYELARWGALDDDEQRQTRVRARELFETTDCRLYLRKMDSEGA